MQPENGNKIAEAEVAVCVTKDLEGQAQLLNIVLQLRPVETPEINVSVFMTIFSVDYEGLYNDTPYTTEELRVFFKKGS